MNISEIKEILKSKDTLSFRLPSGELVPRHFHVTEVGKVTKNFIDCGGTLRNEEVVNFQLWDSDDYDHRLHPEKLIHIIELSQNKLGIEDALEIEVEYQGTSIEKFHLDFNGEEFELRPTHTDCLAKEACAVPEKTGATKTAGIEIASCSPDGGCC